MKTPDEYVALAEDALLSAQRAEHASDQQRLVANAAVWAELAKVAQAQPPARPQYVMQMVEVPACGRWFRRDRREENPLVTFARGYAAGRPPYSGDLDVV